MTAQRRARRDGDAAEAKQESRGGSQRVQRVPKGIETALVKSKPIQQRKYRNVPCEVDDHRFDSRKEAERYGVLVLMQRAGEIRSLEVHPRFPLAIHGQDCGVYEADFAYVTRDDVPVVEDVKSPATRKLPTYRLKRRLAWALYGLEIREI